jgi:insulysin
MYVTTHGYSDKMAVLVEHILDKVKSLNVRQERLDVVKEQVSMQFPF